MSINIPMPEITERILMENNERYVIFPIKDQGSWDRYKAAEANVWHASEIDLADDINQWNNKLTNDERYFLMNVLGFFAASDGIVGENLAENFYSEVQIPEARFFYGFQIFDEQVHSEVYSRLIDTYVKNEDDKQRLFNSIEEIPCVKKKADWAIKWMNKNDNFDIPYEIKEAVYKLKSVQDKIDDVNVTGLDNAINMISTPGPSFAERIVAFAVVEGIFFSGSFCSIFWMRKRGLLPGLCLANDMISQDEASHCEFAVYMYSKLENKLTQERVHYIFSEAVSIEKEFICESIPCPLIGMNADMMSQYIEYIADFWLDRLGYAPLYNATNPFDWMDMINNDILGNFFEKRVAEYQIAGVKETGKSTRIDSEESDDFDDDI